ncbi:tripartite tricarboxylate transporter TctB family protein [Virgibacillus sp. JSM 102003]|uniref:tripartite tricarboxylate transporter TctB family protein n=1 Tax=Virgibacillus sp. JSM 102003 TaxID=1562108 RepID=UPI0035BF5D2D
MKISQNKVTGLFCLIFSLFFVYQAFQIETPPSATMDFLGPSGFPFIIGGLMVLCSLGILFISKNEKDDNDDKVGPNELKSLLPYLLLIFLFILIVPFVGMFIGLLLLAFFMIRLIEKGKLLKELAVSSCVAIAVWVIFDLLLNLSMPMWPILFR